MKKLQLLFLALLPLIASGQAAHKWVQYYNAVGNDRNGRCITTDASGNVFASGIANINAYQTDVVTVKYDSLGKELWTHQYVGPYSGQSVPTKIMTDNSGNLYVLATSTSGTTLNVLYKLDPSGALLWQDTIVTQTPTGWYGSILHDMTYNTNGDIVVAGALQSYTVAGYPYWFMAAFTPSGTELWRNLTAVDYATNEIMGIAAAPAGVMYAAGYENHGNPPGERLVFRKYNASGVIDWQIIYDADSTTGENERANCIKADAAGNLYLLGYASFNGKSDYDYLLRKYDPNGNLVWSSTYSSKTNGGMDMGRFLYVTAAGESYAYGTVDDEVHLVKFDASGAIMWARPYRYDPAWPTYIGEMDVDPATGNVVISGTERRASGMIAGFAVKFKSNGDTMWVKHMVRYGDGVQVHIGTDHSVYLVGTGQNAMQAARITDADITLERNVTGPGLYDFNDNTGKTGIKLDSLNAGLGDIMAMLLHNQVANTSWCSGTNQPSYFSDYRWVIENMLTSFTSAILSIDLLSLVSGLGTFHGMIDPSKFSIYQRPLDGEGEFCKLITTYTNGALTAPITHLSEFFIGSETDSFQHNPVNVPILTGAGTLAMQLNPNPATAFTHVNFKLNCPGMVALAVYDISGRVIQKTVPQSMNTGNHRLKIDLSGLGNGAYFCKLSVDGVSTGIQKLIVNN